MTGGLVLGETLNLWIPAEQMIFGLAVWLLFLVCVFARRKSRYGLPVFLFVAGMSAGCLRMGAEQAVFSREEGFFREEHEDGVVLQGTVQSVKEKDGTLEVVLRDCAMEGKDGESGEKLRRVLCYLDVNKTGEAAEAVSKQKPSPAVGEKIRVFGEGKTADPARNPGAFDYRLYCRSRGISGIIYAEGYTVTGGKVHVFSDSLYRIRRCLSERLKAIALPEDAGILSAVLLGRRMIWTVKFMNFTGRMGYPTSLPSAGFMSPLWDWESGRFSGKAGRGSGSPGSSQGDFSAPTA